MIMLEALKRWWILNKLKREVGGTISKRYGKHVLDLPDGVVHYDENGIFCIHNVYYSAADDMEARYASTYELAVSHIKALKKRSWGFRDRPVKKYIKADD
jgi:hypothetical protein